MCESVPMQATDAKFAGSIPELYDRYLGQLLFAPYANDLTRRLSALQRGTLVEVAAGTGIVTRALRAALPADVRIIATDLNEAMLKVAASRVSEPTVTFQQADAQKLPFADASADAIVCQFGIMFMPDKGAAYREAARVLAPGGLFVFNVWDQLVNNEVSLIVTQAVQALYPQDPPRFFERTPFGDLDRRHPRRAPSHRLPAHRDRDRRAGVPSRLGRARRHRPLPRRPPLRSEIESTTPKAYPPPPPPPLPPFNRASAPDPSKTA